jgi:hypothetical protein
MIRTEKHDAEPWASEKRCLASEKRSRTSFFPPEGAGTHEIHIRGFSRLHGAEHAIIPDRIEAGTFLSGTRIPILVASELRARRKIH